MDANVAVARYPEGVGHATRMLAVAEELRAGGASVVFGGGGPGGEFVERLGYEEEYATPVDFIGDYQEDGGGNVATGSLPNGVRRVRDFVDWLRRERPAALVTDDVFAGVAATIARVPLYALTHNTPGFYRDRIERVGASLFTSLLGLDARAYFYPAVWPPLDVDPDPDRLDRIPPVALDVDAPAVDADVLVVPSTFSSTLDEAADRLETSGHDVVRVGGPDWEPVDALLPSVRAADRVLCAGYSTVMEAAVAGTPCVIAPSTSEQRGVANAIERGNVDGFRVADGVDDVVAAVDESMPAPAFDNGAPLAARHVLDTL